MRRKNTDSGGSQDSPTGASTWVHWNWRKYGGNWKAIQFQSLSIVFVCAVNTCAKISYFDGITLWFYELITCLAICSLRMYKITCLAICSLRMYKLEFFWEKLVMKTVYDLHSYWTSMAAILASLFSLAEWLKFLLQIYRAQWDEFETHLRPQAQAIALTIGKLQGEMHVAEYALHGIVGWVKISRAFFCFALL
jgi:hypothetical protein